MINKLVIISGLSGAGKTSALKCMEDNGFQVIDNLPISLFEEFVKNIYNKNNKKFIAIGIDSRNLDFSYDLIKKFVDLLVGIKNCSLVYLECNQDQILRRYNESRRPHPVNSKKLINSISKEKKLLVPLRQIAEIQIDTTELQIRQLHKILSHYFFYTETKALRILFISFSYKKGMPTFADFVVDMRFLSNPFYIKEMQNLCGKDEPVKNFLKNDSRWVLMRENFFDFIVNAIKGYEENGRAYLTVAFGCTGGQHRSVFTAEFFNKYLSEIGYDCCVEHRDLKI